MLPETRLTVLLPTGLYRHRQGRRELRSSAAGGVGVGSGGGRLLEITSPWSLVRVRATVCGHEDGKGGKKKKKTWGEKIFVCFFVKQNKQEILPEAEEKEEGGGGALRDTTSSRDAPAERRSQQVRGIPSTDTDSLSNRGQRAATAFPPQPVLSWAALFARMCTVRFNGCAMRRFTVAVRCRAHVFTV